MCMCSMNWKEPTLQQWWTACSYPYQQLWMLSYVWSVTNGHLCMFNQALYLVECTNWCIYGLFINDKDRIKRDCFLRTLNWTTYLVYSLDRYLWAVSALAAERLQIRSVMETHVITVKPPLQIMDVGNGCKAYSASIYIPAKSELTATLQLITRSQF